MDIPARFKTYLSSNIGKIPNANKTKNTTIAIAAIPAMFKRITSGTLALIMNSYTSLLCVALLNECVIVIYSR